MKIRLMRANSFRKRTFAGWMRAGHVSPENRQHIRTQEQRDLGVGFDPTFHAALKRVNGQLG
jgi:hypothetical protein